MADTAKLTLPLLEAAQAQKHVTVNEALQRLDAAAHLTLISRTVATPPTLPVEGDCYGVPVAAVDDWAGEDGRVAVYSNGGWQFIDPVVGWRGWIVDESVSAIYDNADWVAGGISVSANGAGLVASVVEVDHVIAAGATSTTGTIIPSGAIVLGVTGRITAAMTGALTSWRLGIAGVSDDRYGAGIGLGAGAWMRGVTGSPQAYYSDTALTLTGEGGDFADGTVRLAVHLLELSLPRA